MGRAIAAIYERYEVPPNLQRHMLRVAAVADLLLRSWHGPRLRRDMLMRVLLLHDIGNIVRCDYDRWPEMLEEERSHVDHWRGVQSRYLAEFGADAVVVTRALAREIGLETEELELLERIDLFHSDEIWRDDDYHRKLACYADVRVAPFGVVSLDERMREARHRSLDIPDSGMFGPHADMLIECAHRIERQVLDHARIAATEINDESVQPLMRALRSFEL